MKTGSKRTPKPTRSRAVNDSGGDGGILGMFMNEEVKRPRPKQIVVRTASSSSKNNNNNNKAKRTVESSPSHSSSRKKLPTTVIVKGDKNHGKREGTKEKETKQQQDDDDPLDISGLTATIKSCRISSKKKVLPEEELDSTSSSEEESESESEEESTSSSSEEESQESSDMEDEEIKQNESENDSDETDEEDSVEEEIAILKQENRQVRVEISSNESDDDDENDEMSEGEFLEDGAYDPDEETESEGESEDSEIQSLDEEDKVTRNRRFATNKKPAKKTSNNKPKLTITTTNDKSYSSSEEEALALANDDEHEDEVALQPTAATNPKSMEVNNLDADEVDSPRKTRRPSSPGFHKSSSATDSEEDGCVEIYTTDEDPIPDEVASPRKGRRTVNAQVSSAKSPSSGSDTYPNSEEEECLEIYTTDEDLIPDEVASPRKGRRTVNPRLEKANSSKTESGGTNSEEEGCVELYSTDDDPGFSSEEEAQDINEKKSEYSAAPSNQSETAQDEDTTAKEYHNDSEIQASVQEEVPMRRDSSLESCAEAEVIADESGILDDASFYVAEAIEDETETSQCEKPAAESFFPHDDNDNLEDKENDENVDGSENYESTSLFADDNDENLDEKENEAERLTSEPVSHGKSQSTTIILGERQPASPFLKSAATSILGERQPASPILQSTEKSVSKKPEIRKGKRKHNNSVKPGKWSLGSKIGRGAFGVVHVGMNTETGRLMAVKSIKMDSAVMKDLRREIELLRTLEHENIVQYFGAQQDKGYLRIFQEWVAGGSVTELLHKFGPFSLDVARSYLSQMLQGLSYLHRNNIMHRDIKGANILVTNEGIVKLADFGASKRMVQMQSDLMMSLTIRGTPYFMAPEVFEEKYSSKADIWAVGCVAYQMVTGSPPWKSEGFTSPVALFNFVKDRNCPPHYELRDGSEASRIYFKAIMDTCFLSTPCQRPTAEELLCESFFVEEPIYTDQSFSDSVIFSPSTPNGGGSVCSPMPSSNRRRNSAGGSPFLSPPLPRSAMKRDAQHKSPAPDMRAWPSWAKRAASEKSMGETHSDAAADSLGYSMDTEDFAAPAKRPSFSSPLSLRHTANTKSPQGLMYLSGSTYNS